MRNFFKKEKEPQKEMSLPKGRELITSIYLSGDGIEIGALHNPLLVPSCAKVKYVDRMTVPELKEQYPELNHLPLMNVDIVDDGEKLEKISDNSQDFVIANHFIEHCQNPLLAIKNMLRVVKSGGVLYIAVPDKKFTFDIDRPLTRFEHIENDYLNGPENSKKQHFEEWVTLVNKIEEKAMISSEIDRLMKIDYSIHYHVWTIDEILDLLVKSKKYMNFNIEMINKNEKEIIFILSK